METERIVRKRRCELLVVRKRRINPFTIYLITSPSGKQYVGQTMRGVNKRWKDHCNNKKDVIMVRAIKKYSPENFIITCLERTHNKEKANKLERFYIKELNTMTPKGYNMSPGGGGMVPGYVLSEKTKQKISQKRIKFYENENNCIAQSVRMKKVYNTEKGKQLQRERSALAQLPEIKEKTKEKLKLLRGTKEYRENKSIEQKERWSDPLLREKHSKIIKEAKFKKEVLAIKELRENISKYTEENNNVFHKRIM